MISVCLYPLRYASFSRIMLTKIYWNSWSQISELHWFVEDSCWRSWGVLWSCSPPRQGLSLSLSALKVVRYNALGDCWNLIYTGFNVQCALGFRWQTSCFAGVSLVVSLQIWSVLLHVLFCSSFSLFIFLPLICCRLRCKIIFKSKSTGLFSFD